MEEINLENKSIEDLLYIAKVMGIKNTKKYLENREDLIGLITGRKEKEKEKEKERREKEQQKNMNEEQTKDTTINKKRGRPAKQKEKIEEISP